MVGVVDSEGGYFFYIQSVDILLEQTKQGQVQRGQPGLLALKNKLICQKNFTHTHTHTGTAVQWRDSLEVIQHLLWRCSGHQMCALSSDPSAPGWQSDGSP